MTGLDSTDSVPMDSSAHITLTVGVGAGGSQVLPCPSGVASLNLVFEGLGLGNQRIPVQDEGVPVGGDGESGDLLILETESRGLAEVEANKITGVDPCLGPRSFAESEGGERAGVIVDALTGVGSTGASSHFFTAGESGGTG